MSMISRESGAPSGKDEAAEEREREAYEIIHELYLSSWFSWEDQELFLNVAIRLSSSYEAITLTCKPKGKPSSCRVG
jgi:hypothetical protein